MKRFKIKYYFDGKGEVSITANSREEAVDMFYDGVFNEGEEEEWGEDYSIDTIEGDLEK